MNAAELAFEAGVQSWIDRFEATQPAIQRQEHTFIPAPDGFCDVCGWTKWVHQ